MIKHIVMFKLWPVYDGKSNLENANIAKRMLDELPGKIGVIRSWQTGLNISNEDRAFDLAIDSTFDNMDDLQAYQIHPAHLEFVAYIKNIREKSHVVDFEL